MASPTLDQGMIVTTDASCIIQAVSWPGIPTLIWAEGIDEAASDWFRDLVIRNGIALTSAHEYANILRPFLRFCRKRKRAWDTADDELLISWREHLRRNEGLSIGRTNSVLKTIFSFYAWAEERRHIHYRVGIYTDTDLPTAMAGYAFPISAKRVFSKARSGRMNGVWTTPLTLSSPETGARRHTPSETEIREIHAVTVERENGERDSLLFSYAEETGARRADIRQIGKSHMPTDDQLADLIEREEPWTIMVKRKGGHLKPLHLPPDLIIRTQSFIEYERRAIVVECIGKIIGYREPDGLFLSSVNGEVLHLDSITSIARAAFRRAGVKNASLHRFRARFAVRTIETLVEALFGDTDIGSHSNWTETILTKASEMMGHASAQSLRPYLNYVLNRRIQTAEATQAHRLAARIRQLKLGAHAYAPNTAELFSAHIPALATLVALDWSYLPPAECMAMRGGNQDVLLTPVLVEELRRRKFTYRGKEYPLSPNAIDQIIRELASPALNEGLMTANERLYNILTLGIAVTEFVEGKKINVTVPIINWGEPLTNSFIVTEEYELLAADGVPESLAGNKHASAYFGLFRLVVVDRRAKRTPLAG